MIMCSKKSANDNHIETEQLANNNVLNNQVTIFLLGTVNYNDNLSLIHKFCVIILLATVS